MKPVITVEKITPAIASKWLTKMVSNRKLSEAKVIEYAISMDRDDWTLNGETIKFMADESLFDGQHRLQACILSGKSFTSVVVRGVTDEKSFATVDAGKIRTIGDVFAISGEKAPNEFAAAAGIIYMYKKNMLTLSGPKEKRITFTDAKGVKKTSRLGRVASDKQMMLEFSTPIAERINDSIKFARRVNGHSSLKKIVSASIIAGCHFLFAEKDSNSAAKFFEDLAEGAGLEKNDPVHALRAKLIANSMSVSKLTRYAIIYLLFKTWNKRRRGEVISVLKIMENEEFPRLV